VVQVAERDREFPSLAAEFWLYATRHPEAMELISAKLAEQMRGLEPLIAAAMERSGARAELSAGEMTVLALVLFDGLVRQRRIDPAAVPDDLFARALRALFATTA
jgi:hypothetical protein